MRRLGAEQVNFPGSPQRRPTVHRSPGQCPRPSGEWSGEHRFRPLL